MTSTFNGSNSNGLAIIGAGDVIMGYQALGFKVYPAAGEDEFRLALSRAIEDGAAVCLIQEDLYPFAKDRIAPYESQPLPVFVPFAAAARIDLLDQMVRAIRLKATGVY